MDPRWAIIYYLTQVLSVGVVRITPDVDPNYDSDVQAPVM